MKYKERHDFNTRCDESQKMIDKYPQAVPTIIESISLDLEKNKYLVPDDLSVGQFVYFMRKQVNLTSEKGIFMYVNEKLPTTTQTMGQLYAQEKDVDGFLYLSVEQENTFG